MKQKSSFVAHTGCLAALRLGVSFLLLVLCPALTAAERPNILLIVSDDQGWPDLGCIGLKEIQTPQLDRLAVVLFS